MREHVKWYIMEYGLTSLLNQVAEGVEAFRMENHTRIESNELPQISNIICKLYELRNEIING